MSKTKALDKPQQDSSKNESGKGENFWALGTDSRKRYLSMLGTILGVQKILLNTVVLVAEYDHHKGMEILNAYDEIAAAYDDLFALMLE